MRRFLCVIPLFLALACNDKGEDPTTETGGVAQDDTGAPSDDTGATNDDTEADDTGAEPYDVDGDGYDAVAWGGDDCDDEDDAVNPGADEVCDGVDNDCDGGTDDDDPEGAVDADTYYADVDADGYGPDSSMFTTCNDAAGAASQGGDCDDGDAAVNPGADEICDGIDNDCDGAADDDDPEGADGGDTWYADVDGDGYGDAGDATAACDQPEGYLDAAGDCDDRDDTVYPGATEYCNGIDDDCDGTIDPDDSEDADTWYADNDGDGYGDADNTSVSCSAPAGYVSDYTDCDDSDDGVTDSGCDAASRDGTYTGTFEIDVTALGLTDTCEGEIEIDVDESASPQLDGEGTCAFTGILASLLPGDQTGTLDGEITTDPDVEGDIDVASIVTSPWSGEFTGVDTLEGEFSGSTSYKGYAVTYSGSFEAER